MNDIATIKDYHEATKHHFRRSARSLGYLDWANQPDPFRRFRDAPLIALPPCPPPQGSEAEAPFPDPLYEDLFIPGKIPPQGLSLETVGEFFHHSLAISAWKSAGGNPEENKWALRVNPSSGNLHPTEGYCLLPAMAGLGDLPGVYHYAPKEHGLERRGAFPQAVWDALPPGVFLVGLSSIVWREAWKYGERAFRYCQHDCGHAYMALTLAARLLGWRVGLLEDVGDGQIAALLGLDRCQEFRDGEGEIPEMIIAVYSGAEPSRPPSIIPADFFTGVANGTWFGQAAPLSRTHHDWPIIGKAERATRKPGTGEVLLPVSGEENPAPANYEQGFSARQVIRKRRSAIAMDGLASLPREAFYGLLSRIAASSQYLPWPPTAHLVLFAHRVDDLTPGLYLLVRDLPARDELQAALHAGFLWERPPECPAGLSLHLLQAGDSARIAKTLGCGQAIAGDGVFSVAMIARFDPSLENYGAWFYKRLFWETGLIGQLLYLEAEAVGLSGTGIGCFFDDGVHELLGLRDRGFQSLYHFTVGGAVVDGRIL